MIRSQIGQCTLIIGNSALGLGRFRLRSLPISRFIGGRCIGFAGCGGFIVARGPAQLAGAAVQHLDRFGEHVVAVHRGRALERRRRNVEPWALHDKGDRLFPIRIYFTPILNGWFPFRAGRYQADYFWFHSISMIG